MWKETLRRERQSAIGTLMLEVALLVFIAAVMLLLLGIIGGLVAHFVFGCSLEAHIHDWLFFWVLIATPLTLAGGAAWVVLRDEYQRILRVRRRKW